MDARLRLEDLWRLPLPGDDVPGALAFTPDGKALTYLYSGSGSLVRSLWWHDLRTDERRVIAGPPPGTEREESLSQEERLRRERTRTTELGVTEFAWATHARQPTLVVPIGGKVLVGTGTDIAQLAAVDGVDAASAAAAAADGLHVAFVRDGEVWVAPLDGAPPHQVTHDASPGVFNGLAEFVAAEELDRYQGMWWSADGKRLAYAHVDERDIPPFAIAHLGADEPRHEEHRYPFAGGPNARVVLRVVAIAGGPPVDVDLGMAPDDYLGRVVSEPNGGWLVAVLPRAQRSLRWLRVSASGSASELWVETAEPWINLDSDTRVLDDGSILRTTERSGFRHIELREADGSLRSTLTGGDWMVTAVVHVDEARREVLFTGTADGVLQRHLYSVSLDIRRPTTGPRRLSSEPGWHEVVVSRDGTRWVDTWSSLDHSPAVAVRERGGAGGGGGEPTLIHQATVTTASLGRRAPELLELVADDGTTPLHAALYRPASPATSPPPCVVWVYGGPHQQYVKDAWEMTVYPLRQYLAQSGVAVLVVDNRGSANRGLVFEAPIAGHFGGVELADQAVAVQQLAAAGKLDPSPVGITGGSYGGFMTLMAAIQRPDLFRAGVAVSPVTDQAGYDTAYTERYLGRPQDEPAAYERSSVLPHAGELGGSVLLIHGAVDENVHLRHSVRLVAALQALGRDVELVILPEDRHRARSADGLRTRDRRTVLHLLTQLGVPLPEELAGVGESGGAG
jgi:dipeptidyl-peptidase-4